MVTNIGMSAAATVTKPNKHLSRISEDRANRCVGATEMIAVYLTGEPYSTIVPRKAGTSAVAAAGATDPVMIVSANA
jgi:hypothetical protein